MTLELLTHSDHIFTRAVELGCEPVLVGKSGLWGCTCPKAKHGAGGTTIITFGSIAAVANAAKAVAR